MLIRKLIAAYLALAAVPDPDPNAGASGTPDPDPNADVDLPDLGDDDAPDPAPTGDPPDTAAELKAEREARAKAEREAADYRTRLADAERARATPPAPVDAEREAWEREEARLRATDLTPNERWTIESNRTLRASAKTSQEALWQAREMADKTEYERLKASGPASAVAKKYESRVEEKLAEIRKNGGNLDRKLVLKMIIGDDYVEGKIKAKAKAEPAPAPADRGRPAMARSDVRRGAQGNSERDKRRARLEGQII